LASGEQKSRIAELERQIAAAANDAAALDRQAEFEQWLKQRPARMPLAPDRVAHFDFESTSDGKLANRDNADAPASTNDANVSVPGKIGRGLRLSGDDEVITPVGNFTRDDPFTFALWMQTPDMKERAVIVHRSRASTDSASRGYQLLLEEGRLSASLNYFWPGNALSIRTREPIATGEWLHVAMSYDGSSKAGGLRIYVTEHQSIARSYATT
jgi:hypothetical protein